jgi:hypothetical protein
MEAPVKSLADELNELLALAPLEPPSLTDLCDSDASGGVSAVVRVRLVGGQTLDFCAHHYAQHEAALLSITESIADGRARLLARPDSGPYDSAEDDEELV